MQHEHKALRVKSLDDRGAGTAVFATFNAKDLDGDITEPGAFGEQDVLVLPTHDWSSVPLGKGRTREAGDQALVDFHMNLDTQAGRDWHAALKFDLNNGRPIQEWSYGFTIKERENKVIDGEEVRILKSLKVHEVSPVVLGAGVGTHTLAMKAAIEAGNLTDQQIAKLAEALAPVLKDHGGSGSRKFADQITDAIEECSDILRRAKAIREERRQDDRDISPERIEQLKALRYELDQLAALSKSIGEEINDGPGDAEIAAAVLEFEGVIAKRRLV